MTRILLAPHNDDETLFASFLCQKYRPKVIVVLRSSRQQAHHTKREAETESACDILGVEYEQWTYSDLTPDWRLIEADLRLLDLVDHPEDVFAPAYDFEGNQWDSDDDPGFGLFHHDKIGLLADEIFGNRVTHYQTYSRFHGRVESGTEVVPTGEMIAAKLAAMSRYQSQIGESSTQAHFLGTIKEWIQ